MGGTARRLVLSFVLATAIYALPVVESGATPAADNLAPRLLMSGQISAAEFTPNGEHVIVGETAALTAFPVTGGPGVSLGTAAGYLALNNSSGVLIHDEGDLYLVDLTTGDRTFLTSQVGPVVRVTDDDKWALANDGDQPMKVEIATGVVGPVPGARPFSPWVPLVDTVANEVLYTSLLPSGDYEIRGFSLDTDSDRSLGVLISAGGWPADGPFITQIYSAQRVVGIIADYGGHGAPYWYYSIDPWALLYEGGFWFAARPHMTSDGTTLLYKDFLGSDSQATAAAKFDGRPSVVFGQGYNFFDGYLQISPDERFASSTFWDPDAARTVAHVYDVATHTSEGLGALTSTVSMGGDGFLGPEPRLLIRYHDPATFEPSEPYSVTISGANPMPWPPHVGLTAYAVGDDVYAMGDLGIYRLNADGTDPVLVSDPLPDGGIVDRLIVSPARDSLVYETTIGTSQSVWLLGTPQPLDPCERSDVITGTTGNDEIIGTDADDIINGLEGNDVIDGKGGNDHICGGDGADYIVGGDGDDVILGGPGSDVVRGSDGDDEIYGGSGMDELVGGRGSDRILGGDDADSIRGHGGADQLSGDAGDDVIRGGSGPDMIWGGRGDDNLLGNRGQDTIRSNAGNNVFDGGPGHDTLLGGSGDDVMRGRGGNDVLTSAAGTSTLIGGAGADSLDLGASSGSGSGGSGDDIIQWRTPPSDNPPSVWGGRGNDTLGHRLSPPSCGVVRGGPGADMIFCDRSGRLVGGHGPDHLSGGLVQYGKKGNDNLLNSERAYGGKGADTITGDDRDNVMHGGAGDDTLFGNDGDDQLFGGPGIDTLDGGNGNDTCTDEGVTTPC